MVADMVSSAGKRGWLFRSRTWSRCTDDSTQRTARTLLRRWSCK